MAIPRVSSRTWDERRNTSAVRPVPPHILPEAIRALAALRRDEPALVKWLEDGHPTLTHDEHRARFGEDYHSSRTRRRSSAG